MTLKQLLSRESFDTDNTPAVIKVDTSEATHTVLCFGFAIEGKGVKFAMFGGSDSTLHAVKGLISVGTKNLWFGEGEKGDFGYEIGARQCFEVNEPFEYIHTQNELRKKVVIAYSKNLHDHYIVAMDSKPEDQLRDFLMAAPFGLPILKEWAKPIFKEMVSRKLLVPLEVYFDRNEFLHMSIYRVLLKEEDCKEFLSEMIKSGIISFPKAGTGEKLKEMNSLNDYLLTYSGQMLDKVTENDKPLHQPMEESTLGIFDGYARTLFPVQSHVATGGAKALNVQKGIIIQGEMSTGKSAMMTAIADGYYRELKKKKGYFACYMVPPTLTKKWATEEINYLLPDAEVHLISDTTDLIQFHQKWIAAGRPKPTRPTFFIISFTTMRNDSIKYMPVKPQFIGYEKTIKDESGKETSNNNKVSIKDGMYCPRCGEKLERKVSSTTYMDTTGVQRERVEYANLLYADFLTRTKKSSHCHKCGEQLWAPKVKTRYNNFKEWDKYATRLEKAIKEGNKALVKQLQLENKAKPLKARHNGRAYRKVSSIEYIRRKMKNFFDVVVCDELHELKAESAQGTALGSLVAASKKFICGTGTLFGGKAADVFYLLWRLFPHKMAEAGFAYEGITEWNSTYGNIETIIYHDESSLKNNIASRGKKDAGERSKVVPGISPYVYTRFLMDTTINVRLKDVWPNPVPLVNVPTVLVDMNDEMKAAYNKMSEAFESAISKYRGTPEAGTLLLSYTRTGVSFPDNMSKYPSYAIDTDTGKEVVFSAEEARIPIEMVTPKEEKLQDIVRTESSQKRPVIIYVSDTGTSNADRDIQPRLKDVVEKVPGVKAEILRTNTVKPPERSDWLKKQIRKGVNVIICSQELVKVGLDLIASPTIIFYQFSWSLFTINQAARRHWRIGQNQECRTYYLAYRGTFQEQMATLIAQKNKASEAMNGDASSDGINAMLGDDGDLQTLLINSIKKGKVLKGSTEEWSAAASEEAKALLKNIGKVEELKEEEVLTLPEVLQVNEQLRMWLDSLPESYDVQFLYNDKVFDKTVERIENGEIEGISIHEGHLSIIDDAAAVIQKLTLLQMKKEKVVQTKQQEQKELVEEYAEDAWNLFVIDSKATASSKGKTKGKSKKKKVVDGQFSFDLFA
ncbi:helicase-related protein [Bacillus cereus]|uniref:Helicase C-terminal domain-containing protein n=1 Tax=Bacillus cereus TaxID=1396 RepID=A0A2C1LQ20_BACCE|nr:helicase-related protein [Bacillus cereus]PGT99834.1 hypothetical protein COD19_18040 [Bacillus cereus]